MGLCIGDGGGGVGLLLWGLYSGDGGGGVVFVMGLCDGDGDGVRWSVFCYGGCVVVMVMVNW